MNEPPRVSIATDGSCIGNVGPGGWAAILVFGDVKKGISGGAPMTTNNQMEMAAVREGLCALKEPCKVVIYTDSQLVIQYMTLGFGKKPELIAIRDQIKRIVDKGGHQVEYVKVTAHNGHLLNEWANSLARAEAYKAANTTKAR